MMEPLSTRTQRTTSKARLECDFFLRRGQALLILWNSGQKTAVGVIYICISINSTLRLQYPRHNMLATGRLTYIGVVEKGSM